MMRSLFSGVSGLNNHQTRMDVIGNNISNVNTTGFKRGRVGFQDILSQTLSGAAKPTEVKGGVNPKQVGLGMTISTIDTIHTQGALQSTGVNTDLAIMGEGFFIEKMGEKTLYSRSGSFGIDQSGLLVNPANGLKVQGYRPITNPDGSVTVDTTSSVADLTIPIGKKDAAKATQIIKYKSNLNSLTPIIPQGDTSPATLLKGTWKSSIDVYDSKGNVQEVQLNFSKALDANGVPIENQWKVKTTIVDIQGRPINNINSNVDKSNTGSSDEFIMTFNTAGSLVSIQDAAGQGQPTQGANTNLSVNLSYDIVGSNPMNITLDLGTAGLYDGITQFANPSSTSAYFQDGMKMGYLESFIIDDSGVITGSYTNGTKKPLGQVALATFTNAAGLSKSGESYYVETPNSGLAEVTAPNEKVAGSIKAGTLEMSNVDLSTEFTDMIITQRGFQANSRTITTSDSMLEELLRLKR